MDMIDGRGRTGTGAPRAYGHATTSHTPEQVEIVRLLKLFGPGPVAFFSDACQLLHHDPTLESVTHLVGHLLRELDGWMRDVMRPMIPQGPEESPLPETGNNRKSEIDALATALGFSPDDPIRRQWKAFEHHRTAHRDSPLRPRPLDRDFRKIWDDAQTVLLRVGRAFESSFSASLRLIDDLATIESPTKDDAKALGQLPHSAVALQKFFDRAKPRWYPLLRARHYFESPPRLETNPDGTVPYARWPAGRYLVRMTADNDVHADLVDVCLALMTDNPEAHECVTEVATELPTNTGTQLAGKVAEFLTTPFQWALPFKAADLVVRWAQAGETDAAIEVLVPMIRAEVDPDRSRSTGRIDKIIPEVFPALGTAGVELFADALDQSITEEFRGQPRWDDGSTIWQPSLHRPQNREVKSSMSSMLRDAALRLAQTDHTAARSVIEILERRAQAIFHRISLHILNAVPDENLIAERLRRRDRFDDPLVAREYDLLLQQYAGDDQGDIHTEILEWIDEGPTRQIEHDQVDEWRLRQLARFGAALPAGQAKRYDQLVARFGAPHALPSDPAPWPGLSSPRTAEELQELSNHALVEFLSTWEPASGWSAPSREGLATQLQEAVTADPARFVQLADKFAATRQIYAHALVDGLRAAAQSGRLFPWTLALSLCSTLIQYPRSTPTNRADGGSPDQQVRIRRAVARLIEIGIDKEYIPAELLDNAFDILSVLAEDPEPDVADEERRAASGDEDPATLDLNTVRGIAFHAIMRLAWRERKADGGAVSRLRAPLRELLDRHLDPQVEHAESIRAVYGQYFPFLVECDPEWTRANIDAIFPIDAANARLGAAAWASYLVRNQAYRSSYELLDERYRAALRDLADPMASDNPSRYEIEVRHGLASHVLKLYVTAVVGLEQGSLIDLFFAHVSSNLRAHLIETIGFDLMEEPNPSVNALERLRELWDWRLVTLQQDPNRDVAEPRGFGWWFASGKFDPRWALSQLHAVLSIGSTIESELAVIEHLAETRSHDLALTVAILARLIDLPEMISQPWRVTHSAEPIRNILRDAITHELEPQARQIVSRLIARGHTQFDDLA